MKRVALLSLLALSLVPGAARAYNEAEKFALSPVEGGGGGRYFTGSARDGYTCAVCHRGAEAPEVEIAGLPEDGYVPGQTYDIQIALPDDAAVTSAVIELANAQGGMMGALEVGPAPERDETCPPAGDLPERNAAEHLNALEGREVIAMDACGATEVAFAWRAPDEPQGSVWFHAAVVAGDASNDPEGDGVRVVTRVLPVQGASATSAEVGSGCGIARTRDSRAPWLAVIVALLLAVRRRRQLGAWPLVST